VAQSGCPFVDVVMARGSQPFGGAEGQGESGPRRVRVRARARVEWRPLPLHPPLSRQARARPRRRTTAAKASEAGGKTALDPRSRK